MERREITEREEICEKMKTKMQWQISLIEHLNYVRISALLNLKNVFKKRKNK